MYPDVKTKMDYYLPDAANQSRDAAETEAALLHIKKKNRRRASRNDNDETVCTTIIQCFSNFSIQDGWNTKNERIY